MHEYFNPFPLLSFIQNALNVQREDAEIIYCGHWKLLMSRGKIFFARNVGVDDKQAEYRVSLGQTQ